MKPALTVAVVLGCAVAAVSAQSPASSFARGSSQQNWQNPGAWGTPSARNRIIAMPTIAQGYTGRAK